MHMENSLKIVEMSSEFGPGQTGAVAGADSTVTSECGIQAAFDTVCRGAQVTPLTRDAGCQYEDSPVPMATCSRVTVTSSPTVIKPSPIKQSSAPCTTKSDSLFVAGSAPLHNLRQTSPIGTGGLLGCTSPDTALRSQIKALQSQVLADEKQNSDALSHALGADTVPDSLVSLLQPGLMNSLPLTSYALLLEMVSRQSSAKSDIFSQLANHDIPTPATTTTTVLKPKPTLVNSAASSPLVTSPEGPCAALNNLSAAAASSKAGVPLSASSLKGVFNGERTSLSNSGILTPVTLLSTASSGVGGLFNEMSPFLRPTTTPSIPTMLNRNQVNPVNRCFGDSGLSRDVDIESLVDSVIDEHINQKQDSKSSANSQYYEMTPPFKRRRRTVFTERQLQGLEEAYSRSQYLDRESRLELCKKLSLSLHTVVYWFQNKRAISRRRGQPLDNAAQSEPISFAGLSGDHNKNPSPSSFKQENPESPTNFTHYSPRKAACTAGLASPPPDMLMTSPLAAGGVSSGSLLSPMNSPPASVMSTTLTSAISNSVLNIGHMVGTATM